MSSSMLLVLILLPLMSGCIIHLLGEKKQELTYNILWFIWGAIGLVWINICIHLPEELVTDVEISDFLYLRFRIDELSILFGSLSIIIFIGIVYYVNRYYEVNQKKYRLLANLFMLYASQIGLFLASDLMTLYVFYVLIAFMAFFILAFDGTEYALVVGRRFVTLALFSGFAVLTGLAVVYVKMGDVNFGMGQIADYSPMMVFGFISLYFGFSVSSLLVPFHSWLTEGHHLEAPISAILFGFVLVTAGPYSTIRVVRDLFGLDYLSNVPWLRGILMVWTMTSILVGSLYAYHEQNLKRRLGFSTVSQINYVSFGILFPNPAMLLGVIVHLISHSLIKVTMYLALGVVYKKTKVKEMSHLSGVGKELPVTMAIFTLAGLSLIGLPPSSGFVAKWYLAMGGLRSDNLIFVVTLLIAAFITAGYLLPITIEAFFKGREKQYIQTLHADINYLMPLGVLTALLLFLGILPTPVIRYLINWIGVSL